MAKILVIDDDAMVRRTIARILRSGGYECIPAEDGRQGIALFREENPDVVVTDMIMPEMHGTEVIREILALRPHTRIIAMSGGGRLANIGFLKSAARLGTFETIDKPFDTQTFFRAITRSLAVADRERIVPLAAD
jgi:DNA-binding NtrC family response regulator